MNKILSLRAFECGTEDFDFSGLFINSDEGKQELPVNVLMFEHRKFGTALVNTGCSDALKKNLTQYYKYKQEHDLHFSKKSDIIHKLDEENIDPLLIRKVLLTHLSPECCGGLPLLPKYEIISGAQVLWLIKVRNIDDEMMKSTMPDVTIPVKAAGIFTGKTFLKDYFKWVYDIFGDGSVLGVDLRGHKQGMMGFYFCESKLFFAADAATDERVLENGLVPSEKMLSLQEEPDEYLVTIMTLRRMYREHPEITVRFLHSRDIPEITTEEQKKM